MPRQVYTYTWHMCDSLFASHKSAKSANDGSCDWSHSYVRERFDNICCYHLRANQASHPLTQEWMGINHLWICFASWMSSLSILLRATNQTYVYWYCPSHDKCLCSSRSCVRTCVTFNHNNQLLCSLCQLNQQLQPKSIVDGESFYYWIVTVQCANSVQELLQIGYYILPARQTVVTQKVRPLETIALWHCT